MALIECPVCDRKISDKAKSCPGCGTSMKDIKKIMVEKEKDAETLVCPECGTEFESDKEHCPKCAYPADLIIPLQAETDEPKSSEKISCPVCDEKYSVDENSCPECGYPRLTVLDDLDAVAEKIRMLRSYFYLHRLMSDCGVNKKEDLALCDELFDDKDSYKKLIRFGDADVKADLKGYIEAKKEKLRIEELYSRAKESMEQAKTEESYLAVAKAFEEISQYEDAGERAVICRDEADKCRKDRVYKKAKDKMAGGDVSSYEEAIKLFREIEGWKDADNQRKACQKKIEGKKQSAEKDKITLVDILVAIKDYCEWNSVIIIIVLIWGFCTGTGVFCLRILIMDIKKLLPLDFCFNDIFCLSLEILGICAILIFLVVCLIVWKELKDDYCTIENILGILLFISVCILVVWFWCWYCGVPFNKSFWCNL